MTQKGMERLAGAIVFVLGLGGMALLGLIVYAVEMFA